MVDAACPQWMSQLDFLRCRSDPYRALDASQRYINRIRKNILALQSSIETAEVHPVVQLDRTVRKFEKLRAEHLVLGDAYNDQLQQRTVLMSVAEAIREEKRALLVEINEARRDTFMLRVECDDALIECRRAEGQKKARTSQVEVQESQLAALAEQERDCSERLTSVQAEFNASTSAAEQGTLQTRSLLDLRDHLNTTHTEQERLISVLKEDVAQREAALLEASTHLWDYKEEMSARVVALQRVVRERQDELERVRRLREHEVDTLAAQNKALADELKTTSESLLCVRTESKTFMNTTRQAISDGQLDVQKYTGIVELVEEQNAGLRSAIESAEEQIHQLVRHTGEKDVINNKKIIEESNLISTLQMELQSTLEDVRLADAQLCSSCRPQIRGMTLVLPHQQQRVHGEFPSPLSSNRVNVSLLPHNNKEEGMLSHAVTAQGTVTTSSDKADEVTLLRDALDALNRQLLEERAAREAERQLESECNARYTADRKTVQLADEERERLAEHDAKKKLSGELALTYTVQFVDGTKKRVDAFPSDTVSCMILRVALRAGITQWGMFYLAQLIDEGGVAGPVHRYLCRSATLDAEGVRPQTVLLFEYKHYKRPLCWDDPVAQEWFFRQVKQHIVCEYYPVSEAVAVRLASYELQAIFGDYTAQKSLLYFDQVGLDTYLPSSVSAHEYDYWKDRLAINHKQRAGLTAKQARSDYIDIVRETPWWGITFFDVRDSENCPFLAGVAEDGFYVFSTTKKECLDVIKFSDLSGWERCPTGVLLRRRGFKKMTLYAMSQLQAKELVELLNEYYMLLPKCVRDEASINIQNIDEVCAGLLRSALFDIPVVSRPYPIPYESRVEYLKAAYTAYCSDLDDLGQQNTPVKEFLLAMDRVVDNGTTLDTLDLAIADPPVDDRHFALFADILAYVLQGYEPPNTHKAWIENVAITSVLLAQSSVERQMLTASSVPKIVTLLTLFPKLQTLDLSYIHLEEVVEELGNVLATKAEQLQRLVLRGCCIGALALQSILLIFSSGERCTLQHLNLEGNFLTHAAIQPLCKVLMNGNTTLTELNLSFNRLEPSAIEALATALRAYRQVQSLDVSGNPGLRMPTSTTWVSLLVSKGTGITRLSLRACEMHFELFVALDTELMSNDDIVELNVSMNPVGNCKDIQATKTAFRFLRGSESVSRVEELRMEECGLVEGDMGDALGSAIAANCTLVQLYLRGNGLARQTGFLSPLTNEAVGVHPALCILDLSKNNISHAGCMSLFAALVHNTSLRELNLSGNSLGDSEEPVSCSELTAFLENSVSLEVLILCSVGMRDTTLQKLAEGLSFNGALHTLQASGNALTPSGVMGFARLIHSNKTLKTLDLSTEAIRADEAVYMGTLRYLTSVARLESVKL